MFTRPSPRQEDDSNCLDGDRLCRLVHRVAAWLHRPVQPAVAQARVTSGQGDSGRWSLKSFKLFRLSLVGCSLSSFFSRRCNGVVFPADGSLDVPCDALPDFLKTSNQSLCGSLITRQLPVAEPNSPCADRSSATHRSSGPEYAEVPGERPELHPGWLFHMLSYLSPMDDSTAWRSMV